MSRDIEFRAREKKTQKMTRNGLVERNEATGEETRVSQRAQDFDLRQARASPVAESAPLTERADPAHRRRVNSPEYGRAAQAGEPAAEFREARAQEAEAPARAHEHETPPPRYGQEDQRRTEHRQGAPKAETQSAPAQELRRPSRLNFTADELPPEPPGKKLANARRKAERTAQKLEAAQDNLPARRKLRLTEESDPDAGKMKRRLKFEKEVTPQSAHVKGPLPLRPIKAGGNAAVGYVHKKLYEVEHENVGTEAAHRTEMVAEGGARIAYRRAKTAPYRKVTRLQKKTASANAKAAYQQVLQDNPQLKKNMLARMWQKQKIKRQYAKAAREAKRAGKAAKKTAVTTEKIAERVVLFVKRHPLLFGIMTLVLLLVFLISSVFSSCSNMGLSGMGSIISSSYLAGDRDIDDAELYYTEWETDLQMEINRAEAEHPGYDEYRYQVDDIGHNPYELMGYLTSVYQSFKYADVQSVLRQIFEEQYNLTFEEETEIRYRTETVIDPETGEETEAEVPYEWRVLNVILTARSFDELIVGRMNADQTEICEILLKTKGNRQYVANVFGETNWLPYVTSDYGYRVHPVSGVKNYHKGVDIGVSSGTQILAGHDGVVTQAGSAGDYGLIVVLEGEAAGSHTLTTKYAHCSQLLVSVGQAVKKGDVIAKVGNTGNSTGPHLHLEVLLDGEYLNPLYFADTGDDGSASLPPGTPGGVEIPAYPGEPMGDGSYAALMEEAQKHLGKPYVFGAKGPDKFDCSGFVCWSLSHSGVKSIATNAQGLYNACTPVSKENARPGDLIFFTGTYSAGRPVTHVGIYIGNGQMIHAGKPVQYASINTRYWTQHFYAFGRIN